MISPVRTSMSRASMRPVKLTRPPLTLPATEPARLEPVTLPTRAPTPHPVAAVAFLQAKRVILPVIMYWAPSSLPSRCAVAASTSAPCWKLSSPRMSLSRSRSTSRTRPSACSEISLV